VFFDVHAAHPVAFTLELFHQACPEPAEGCPPMKPPAPQTKARFMYTLLNGTQTCPERSRRMNTDPQDFYLNLRAICAICVLFR
jgi:hypothetical protein